MFRKFDIRIPFLLALNLLYVFIISTVNSELAPYVCLMLPAVFIVAPALFLGFGGMLFVVGVTAFFAEATTPVRTGMTAFVWLLAAFWIHGWRYRFKTLDSLGVMGVSQAANLVIILVFAVFMKGAGAGFMQYASRLGADMLASAAVLAFCAKFTVSLPVSIMGALGLDITVSEGD